MCYCWRRLFDIEASCKQTLGPLTIGACIISCILTLGNWKNSLPKSSTNVQNYTLWCSWLLLLLFIGLHQHIICTDPKPHKCSMQCYTDYRKYIMYTKNVNSMSWPYVYILSDCVHVYLAFAAQSHCYVLWNCICHTSLTLDLVLRPK